MELAAHRDDLGARDWNSPVEDSRRFAVVGLGGFALPAIDAADHCRTGPRERVAGEAGTPRRPRPNGSRTRT